MKIVIGKRRGGCLFGQLDTGTVFIAPEDDAWTGSIWLKIADVADVNAVRLTTARAARIAPSAFVTPAYNATLVLYPKKDSRDT